MPITATSTTPGRGGSRVTPPPRTLADELRTWSLSQLRDLLRFRPDLITPAPPDISTIATRAAHKGSVARALESLDTLSLNLLDALLLQPSDAPANPQLAASYLGCREPDLAPAFAALRTRALSWGPPTAIRILSAARDLVGPYPAALGPELVQCPGLIEPQQISDLLAQAPPGALAILQTLTAGPPIGSVPDAQRQVTPESASTSVDWLLAHGLLAVSDAEHVLLPREIAIHLRGGTIHPKSQLRAPDLELLPLHHGADSAAAVNSAAGGAAHEVLRLLDDLAELWGLHPPAVLRAGGLGIRDFRRTASTLELSEAQAALLIELGAAAGLLAQDGESPPSWAPTVGYDLWAGETAANRWTVLAQAWLRLPRAPELVGTRCDRGIRTALGPELSRPSAPLARRDALTEWSDLQPGVRTSPESLLARIRWRRPRHTGPGYESALRAILAEAEFLGVTGFGALGAAGRQLYRDGTSAELAAAIADYLPTAVDYVLLQADLTAVAPGPLTPAADQLMRLVAEVESRGGATVYRFTAGSIRRALDAGWSAADLNDQLGRHSRTPVPQPLSYLITDVARRHGQIRVGSGQCYVRSDDPALLREISSNPRLAELQLRSIAPTILISPLAPEQVLGRLRTLGLAPAAESALGELVIRRPELHRSATPRSEPRWGLSPTNEPSPELLDVALRNLSDGPVSSRVAT